MDCNGSSSRWPKAIAAFGSAVMFVFALFVVTCTDKTTQPQKQTPTVPPDVSDISELQHIYGQMLVDMSAQMDTSAAKDSVVKLILRYQDLVESATANSQGIAIQYRDGQRGGIMIDPEDMAGGFSDYPGFIPKPQASSDTTIVPSSHSSTFLCPIYSERRAYADQIIQAANENLPNTGFTPFEVVADGDCGIERFEGADNCGVLHIYSYSFAWPRKDSIEDVYVMTGDTSTADLRAEHAADIQSGKVASMYVPGRGNAIFINHGFFTNHNHFGGNSTVVYLGFGYGFASKWYQHVRFVSNAGVCIGYDWRVYANRNADWASQFYQMMCDTSTTRQTTIADWYGGIATSYIDTLEATAPAPLNTWIRYYGVADISMWMSVRILSISPLYGVARSKVTIRGVGFGNSRKLGKLTFCGLEANIQSWSDTLIVAYVPLGATTGVIQVTVGTISSNPVPFWVFDLTGVQPNQVIYGDTINLTGTGFGPEVGDGSVIVSDMAAPIVSWSDTSIYAIVPDGAKTGDVFISKYGVPTVGVQISVFGITGIVPSRAARGNVIDVHTAGFVCDYFRWIVYFDTIPSTTAYGWGYDMLHVEVPAAVPSACSLTIVCGQWRCKGFPLLVTGITGMSANWGGPGSEIRIYGTGFGDDMAAVVFQPGATAEVSLWTDDSIVTIVPEDAVTGAVRIEYGGAPFQTPTYKVLHIDRLEPAFGLPGKNIKIWGTNFLDYRITDSVTFGDHNAELIYWSDTMATVAVPKIQQSENVTLHVKGARSNRVSFTLLGAERIEPIWGLPGTEIKIIGRGFSTTPVSVLLTGQSTPVWHTVVSDTLIKLTVPSSAKSGPVQVKYGESLVAGFYYDVFRIDSIVPTYGVVGDLVRISGSGFGSYSAGDSVWFGSKLANVSSWTSTAVSVIVPADASTSEVKIVKNRVQATGGTFTVYNKPVVLNLIPIRGTYGTAVQLHGLHFGEDQGNGSVKFGGVTAQIASWSDTLISATYPSGCKSGSLTVTAGGFTSDPVPYTVHGISSVSPTTVASGVTIEVKGAGFGPPLVSSYVRIGDMTMSYTSWSDSVITAIVPELAVSGPVTVTVDGLASNPANITVVHRPILTSIDPSFGTYGMQTTLSGQRFGTSQGSSKVYFGSKAASIVSWSDQSIVAKFPDGSASDTVTVVVSGFGGNTLQYRVFGITSMSKYWANPGDTLTVLGHGFGASQSSSHVEISGEVVNPLIWSNDSIAFLLPPDAEDGDVAVVMEGVTSNAKQLTIGLPTNLMELLHQTRIIEVSYTGPMRFTLCYRYPNDVCSCHTYFGLGSATASNAELARSGYAVLVWDSTHFSAEHRWYGQYESHSTSVTGDAGADGTELTSAFVSESHSINSPMSGSSRGASGFGRDLTLYDFNVADTVIRYQSFSTAGCGQRFSSSAGYPCGSSFSGVCVDSLKLQNPPTVIVTFRRK